MSIMLDNSSIPPLRHFTSSSGLVTPTKDRERERERRVSARGSQHLTAGSASRLGSRSPNSIPSSPTSVHSSSSAIFERDIEPITCPSPPHPHHPHPYTHAHPTSTGTNQNSTNPHRRTPRSKANEQLDQSVPTVLDSAAAILASCTQGSLEDDRVSVVAPATREVGGLLAGTGVGGGVGGGLWSGVTSPIGSLRSRSPSPTAAGTGVAMGPGAGRRTSLLLSIPSSPLSPQQTTKLPLAAPPNHAANLSIQTSETNGSTPSIVTPTSAYYSVASSAETHLGAEREHDGSSPLTTTVEHHPPSSFPAALLSQSQPTSPVPLPQTSHPPSPLASPLNVGLSTSPLSIASSPLTAVGGDKRLSFMSYTDLLASTPASLQPLSSFTTSASSAEPPPHIPSVSGITQASAQFQAQAQAQAQQMQGYSPSHSPGRSLGTHNLNGSGVLNVIEGRERGRSGVPGGSGGVGGDRDSIGVFDDVGGEWEREGMGSGLEERLEALLNLDMNLGGGAGVPVQGRA